jgi:hypothetical protein
MIVMNSDLYFDGKKFISSNRAAKISGYVNDYIGQLCRDGKLDCRMVGRSWYVSFESLILHKNANGNGTKSRSQKHNRKVVSILPELLREEAVEQASSFSVSHAGIYQKFGLSETPHFGASSFNVKKTGHVSKTNPLRVNKPKIKLPSELWADTRAPFVFHVSEKVRIEREKIREHKEFLTYMFPRATAGVLSLFFAIAGFWFALNSNPEAELAYRNVFNSFKNNGVQVLAIAGDTLEANVFSGTRGSLDRVGIAVYRTINGWIFKTQRRILVMAGREPKTETITQIELDNSKPNQGMVVVPTDAKTDRQAVVTKIKNSFSDEVTVEPSADGTNGVITPVFKKAKGDDYLYVLVPIKN